MEVGIIGLEDEKRKDEEALETNEWWVIIRLQVTMFHIMSFSLFYY